MLYVFVLMHNVLWDYVLFLHAFFHFFFIVTAFSLDI